MVANANTPLLTLNNGTTIPQLGFGVFKVDPDEDAERLERMHRTHLARAHWMRDQGYEELGRKRFLSS